MHKYTLLHDDRTERRNCELRWYSTMGSPSRDATILLRRTLSMRRRQLPYRAAVVDVTSEMPWSTQRSRPPRVYLHTAIKSPISRTSWPNPNLIRGSTLQGFAPCPQSMINQRNGSNKTRAEALVDRVTVHPLVPNRPGRQKISSEMQPFLFWETLDLLWTEYTTDMHELNDTADSTVFDVYY